MAKKKAAKKENKSDFLRRLVRENPRMTYHEMNRRWAAAGHAGEISSALYNRVRADVAIQLMEERAAARAIELDRAAPAPTAPGRDLPVQDHAPRRPAPGLAADPGAELLFARDVPRAHPERHGLGRHASAPLRDRRHSLRQLHGAGRHLHGAALLADVDDAPQRRPPEGRLTVPVRVRV